MISLFLRNLFFTILQPGIVAGLIPFLILGDQVKKAFGQTWQFYHYCGVLLFLLGFIIMSICIVNFAVRGRGTLSPADPTKKLVATGLYQFSRNPMYVGVTSMLIGEAIFFQSPALSLYALLIFTAFHLFIAFFEEPRLKKDFGDEYGAYCKKVRRWL